MEVIRGIQAKWERWKSDPERQLKREERKRYGGETIVNPVEIYRDLPGEDKDFVNKWAKKIIGWGDLSEEKHWKMFLRAIKVRAMNPGETYAKKFEETVQGFGSSAVERSLYEAHLFFALPYRIWLMKRRKELGLPPPRPV